MKQSMPVWRISINKNFYNNSHYYQNTPQMITTLEICANFTSVDPITFNYMLNLAAGHDEHNP
jgi:hypothetical protein